MSTLLRAASGTSLKNKAMFFFILTVLLNLIAMVAVFTAAGQPVSVLVLLFLLLCTLVVAMICFQQYVLKPLTEVNAVTRLMIDGHFDTLNRIKRQDEIGRLSESINDMVINMQEVLLFVWNHSRQTKDALERITGSLDASPEAEEILPALHDDLREAYDNNEDLRSIVMSFRYFDIKLEQEKMLADSDCRQYGSSCVGTVCGEHAE